MAQRYAGTTPCRRNDEVSRAVAPEQSGETVKKRSDNKRTAPISDARHGHTAPGSGDARLSRDRDRHCAADPRPLSSEIQSPTNLSARPEDAAWTLVFGCWVIASVSTLGALFFSEVMELPPCVLCWYQRIFMFPLVLLLPVGLFPFDPKIVRYALPILLVGWLVSVFHLLLVTGFIPESIKPCTQGVPCTDVQVEWLGFVTIPLLSCVAFSGMIALLIAAHYRSSK